MRYIIIKKKPGDVELLIPQDFTKKNVEEIKKIVENHIGNKLSERAQKYIEQQINSTYTNYYIIVDINL